jgi:hypothetical protein
VIPDHHTKHLEVPFLIFRNNLIQFSEVELEKVMITDIENKIIIVHIRSKKIAIRIIQQIGRNTQPLQE